MNYSDNYRKWLENCDEDGRRELLALEGNDKEIKERFTLPLAFGTAGMRGTIAYGIANMNVYTVARATKGLADYVNACGAAERGVVISYDTRNFSYEFAMTTARVLGAQGVKVFLFENVRPVPVCSFAVRETGAIAGVMITASHNPKEYNGYKVYGEDGAQMSPEATAEVVAYIDKEDYFGIPQEQTCVKTRDDVIGGNGKSISDHITVIGKDIDEKYYAAITKLSLSPEAVKAEGAGMKLVYSPLHGSGYIPVTTMLARMGIHVDVVEEQRLPDGNFPTVGMPNPEQPDALALGIKLADKVNADAVIGTDPDCDRMGVAIRDDKGKFVLLTGNQTGALLMDYILRRRSERGDLPSNGAVVKTIVTTRLADKIAKSYGVTPFDVLTGFKFIGEKIKEWESSGEYTFLFGYEESYGYLSGTHARDKDAVVAAMLFAEMVCYYQFKGQRLYDVLDGIFKKFGYFAESSTSFAFKGLDGMSEMGAIMDKARKETITELCGKKPLSKTDFLSGVTTFADGSTAPSGLPKTNVIKYDLGDDEWVCIRPSGTEPKLKLYVSVNAGSREEAKARNAAFTEALKKDILG